MSIETARAIEQRLQNILQSNGYNTNAGANARMGWRNLDAGQTEPSLTFAETGYDEDERSGRVPGSGKHTIDWSIEALVPVTGNLMEQVYEIDDDVRRAIFELNNSLEGTCRGVAYQGREMYPESTGSSMARLVITITTKHTY